jgi:hypothetical protein
VDSFESRLRLALAQDRAEYAAAPGMEARVRSVTRRRAVQRRTALAAGVAVIAVVAWLPLRAGVGGPTGGAATEAVRTRSNDRAATPGSATAPALPQTARSGVPASTPSAGRPRPPATGRGLPALAPAEHGKASSGRPQPSTHTVYPVVKLAKKQSAANIDLVPMRTPNSSAVASVVAMDVAEATEGLNIATVLCAVDGPDTLTVGETGTWTSVSSGASEAHWANGDPASSPYSLTFPEPGSYEIVLEVTYDGLATMQCHRAVTVDPVPDPDPPVTTEPGPEPDPTEVGGDPTTVDGSGEPTDQTAEVTADSASTDPEAIRVGDAAP